MRNSLASDVLNCLNVVLLRVRVYGTHIVYTALQENARCVQSQQKFEIWELTERSQRACLVPQTMQMTQKSVPGRRDCARRELFKAVQPDHKPFVIFFELIAFYFNKNFILIW